MGVEIGQNMATLERCYYYWTIVILKTGERTVYEYGNREMVSP